MKLKKRLYLGIAAFAVALLSASIAGAQRQPTAVAQASFSYDSNHETQIQGTVVSFTRGSEVAPIGPHATIKTSSGMVDVHLGNADRLKINNVSLVAGDSVKIVGANHNYGNGNVFLARILQKGNQTVTLRNAKGLPLAPRLEGPVKTRSILGGAQ
jgi:hypothetical protein